MGWNLVRASWSYKGKRLLVGASYLWVTVVDNSPSTAVFTAMFAYNNPPSINDKDNVYSSNEKSANQSRKFKQDKVT